MTIANARHAAVVGLKRFLYGRRGEPYEIGPHTLRFVPGTRPVRLRYADSPNGVNRYDALQLRYLRDHVSPGMVCLDIGAHHGQDALILAALAGPTGFVAAFEPDPHALGVLSANLALNPNIFPPTVEPVAVSDHPGQATFYSRGGNANSSLVAATVNGGAPGLEEFTVSVTTVDQWVRETGRRPDIIKIDVEGAEIHALEGAAETLQTNAIILCELHPYAWEEFGVSFGQLEGILRRARRRASYLDDRPFDASHVQGVSGYGIVRLERY